MTSIKSALLDQRIIAGLGNIDVANYCFAREFRRDGWPHQSSRAFAVGRRRHPVGVDRGSGGRIFAAMTSRPTASSVISSTAGRSQVVRPDLPLELVARRGPTGRSIRASPRRSCTHFRSCWPAPASTRPLRHRVRLVSPWSNWRCHRFLERQRVGAAEPAAWRRRRR